MIHELKTESEYFQQVKSGEKTFELRKNDRGFKVGDELWLHEVIKNDVHPSKPKYTGELQHRYITHILYGPVFGLKKGWCIISLGY